MEIAIPSKGRAGKVPSLKVCPDAVLYVPAFEEEAYRRAHPDTSIVPVPDDVRGITKTRNFILDHTPHNWVVMVDDDVRRVGWVQLGDRRIIDSVAPVRDVHGEFLRLFDLTEQFGYRIWGVATQGAPRSVYPYRPFLFQSYVTASCMGIRNDTGIRFDESFPVKEDYEIGLRCIKEDGGILAARYWFWENSHWVDEGGCKDYRTGEMELKCIERLIEKYGSFIRRVHRQGTNYSIELDF